MSSLMMNTSGCRTRTSVSFLSSARVYAAPVGLEGELSSTHLVRGVIARSSASGVILKPDSIVVGTATGSPPASITISG